MNNPTPIAIRYTDEIYATPAQVGKSLHMIVYDDFWNCEGYKTWTLLLDYVFGFSTKSG